MRRHAQTGSFLVGLAWGAVIGFALMVTPVLWLGADTTMTLYGSIAPRLHRVWHLTNHNLQGSILPFIIVLLAYWRQLHQLRQLLAGREPPLARVVRHEQLLDLCANLFFGIGVIWTAIGMRDALLYALGDPGITATEGAFAILQRMVDGGILLALSTTIVGGIGGYLMRAIKSISLGEQLNAVYMRASQQPGAENLAALQRIERLLGKAPEENSQGSP
jgi:hypothetical protein